jgi:glycosyltransferase involved in cell wall biosynthesis
VLKVSIILPVFNAAGFIGQSIESILSQSFEDWELIIVNDGSNDASISEIRRFLSDKRVRLLENPHNSGLSFSRKRGIAEAKGEIVFFMDADDVSAPNRVALQLQAFSSDPRLVACGGCAAIVNEHGKELGKMIKPGTTEAIKAQLFFGFPFVTPTLAFRGDALKKAVRFVPDDVFEMADDYILLTALLNEGSFCNIREEVLYYRVHTTQARITNDRNNAGILTGRMIAWRHLLSLLQIPSPSDEVLLLHDKLCYYRQRVTPPDMAQAGPYLQLLADMQQQNATLALFDQPLLAQEISARVYSLLIHARLGLGQAWQLGRCYQHLLLSAARSKWALNKLRRWLLRMPH